MKKFRHSVKIRTFLFSIVFCFIQSCSDGLASRSEKKERAGLSLSDTLIGLGLIKRDSTCEFSFLIRSIGKVPLIIKGMDAGCDCTVADYNKSPILNGDSTAVTVVFTPQKDMEGKFYKTLVISTNAKKRFSIVYFWGEMKKERL